MRVFSSAPTMPLCAGFSPKQLLVSLAQVSEENALAEHLEQVPQYPRVVEVSAKLPPTVLLFRYGAERTNGALEISMPCGTCSLLWMPWLPHQEQPARQPGDYQHMFVGKTVV